MMTKLYGNSKETGDKKAFDTWCVIKEGMLTGLSIIHNEDFVKQQKKLYYKAMHEPMTLSDGKEEEEDEDEDGDDEDGDETMVVKDEWKEASIKDFKKHKKLLYNQQMVQKQSRMLHYGKMAAYWGVILEIEPNATIKFDLEQLKWTHDKFVQTGYVLLFI